MGVIRAFVDAESARLIEEALRKLEADARLVLKDAGQSGADVLRDEIESRAPRATGEGAAHIITEVWSSSTSKVELAVGPDRDHFYLLFQEFGADEHTISPKNRKALKIDDGLFAGADHPGVRARPFMRPALDTKKDEVIDKIGDVLKAKLGL